MLQAAIADRLALLLWAKTEEARTGRNRPESLVEMLLATEQETLMAFDSGQAFETTRKILLEQGEGLHGDRTR